MQFHKFAGSFLVAVALSAVTMPSFTSPAMANPRIIPDSIRKNAQPYVVDTLKGKIYDNSNNVNCAEISVYIKKLLSDGSAQNIISAQAQGNYQKDGFCTYTYPVTFVPEASSYIVVATYNRDRDYCGDNGYCDVKQLGQDLSMYLHLH